MMKKAKKQSATVQSLLAGKLLDWFIKNARDLPWRQTRDPYGIWISEIMLQQTQVKTVIPYWIRWMKALPTMEALASASEDRVLKLWEGLGYYSRARNIQKAAKLIVSDHSGKFPTEFDQVLALPGIGRYTAGAILSIAYNQPVPILDGNVIRVLTRLECIEQSPRQKETNNRLWEAANQLVCAARKLEDQVPRYRDISCSYLNQSLMELGALVCAPRAPMCATCPLQEECLAKKMGAVERIPKLEPRQATQRRCFVAVALSDGERFLVRQRAEHEVNGKLWEFPNFELPQKSKATVELIYKKLGVKLSRLKPLVRVTHHITNNCIRLESYVAEYSGKFSNSGDCSGKWLTLDQLQQLAFPSAHRKIFKALASHQQQDLPSSMA